VPTGISVVELSPDVKNIGQTRQAICTFFEDERVWMIDDDTLFAPTILGKGGIIRMRDKLPPSEEEWYSLMEFAEALMNDGYSHGAIPIHVFPKQWDVYWPFRPNTYGSGNTFLDLTKIKLEDLEYGKHGLFEDAYTFLSLIRKGYDQALIHTWYWHQPNPLVPGGCFTYRNSDDWNAAIRALVAEFPGWCRARVKPKHLSGMPGTEPPMSLTVSIPHSAFNVHRRCKK
jgi:hypothetical protein